jgi:hypothetical protein
VAHQVAAQRNSRLRPAGTLEWKSLSLTKEVYRGYLFEKVVPTSILQHWPQDNRHVRIQHGNATSHLSPAEFWTRRLELKDNLQNTHGGSLDWDIELYCQPANSPDMNVNNPCFFASLQALKYHDPTNFLHEMIQRLRLIYEEYPWAKLNNSYLTLQTCMNQVVECNGRCNYRIQMASVAWTMMMMMMTMATWTMMTQSKHKTRNTVVSHKRGATGLRPLCLQ